MELHACTHRICLDLLLNLGSVHIATIISTLATLSTLALGSIIHCSTTLATLALGEGYNSSTLLKRGSPEMRQCTVS
jgi:hypothetical protein